MREAACCEVLEQVQVQDARTSLSVGADEHLPRVRTDACHEAMKLLCLPGRLEGTGMPPIEMTVEVIASLAIALLFAALWLQSRIKARRLEKKFQPIVSVETEVAKRLAVAESDAAKLRSELGALEHKRAETLKDLESRRAAEEKLLATIKSEHAEAEARYSELQVALRKVEEDLSFHDLGLYRPHFDYSDAESYRRAIQECREEIKLAIKQGSAVIWGATWQIEGSSSKGERMQKQYGNLMLRAFNGECEAAIAAVTWSNITKMEARLSQDFEAINKLGSTMKAELNSYYLGLRLKELRLVHEHAQKKQAEAEEQRRIKEMMREEERVLRELEKAKQDADADERRYQKALERARAEAASAKGAELADLNEKVKELERSLAEAHARGERAVSQAQLTKSGHVYIISNVGSFGGDVFKIGMTRRFDPMERVKELSDASVPFSFDVHALIHSEDAPALEAKLHKQFAHGRLNLVNDRKEFFRVDLSAIEEYARAQGLAFEMTMIAEAREYRESELRRRDGAGRSSSAPGKSG